MLVCLFGITVAKGPLGRHKVTGDQVGKVDRKGTQLIADLLVELFRGDVRGEGRQFLTLSARSLIPTIRPFVPTVASSGTIALAAEPTIAIAERASTAVVAVERGPLPTAGTVITVVGRPVTATIVAVERGPVTAAGAITVERGPITATVVAVERRPLPTAGTVITVERRPVTTAATVLTT